MLMTGCSAQRNTAKSRWWQAFNTRYNVYYNGSQAYIDGSLEKENGNADNFTELIPLYTVGNKNSRELGKTNFDRAIEKSQKAIHLHSIKRRPEWKPGRHKTAKDIEWLSRREYNPFLWKAWMLMGRAQFHEGSFDDAASTFAYMSRLYRSQPAIYGKARAWLAKAYIEEGWLYDAEDVIRNMQRDSIHWTAQKEWDYTYTDYYIHTGEYDKAIPYLRKVIRHEMRRKQRAREWFLLGQLLELQGNKAEALKAYQHVIRLNPPYNLEFNARISMTKVMPEGPSDKMISRLKRMASSPNNAEYLDQVYYAIGNIYLARRDTLHAIDAYEQGNQKAKRSGIEKGVLLLKLGNLYWNRRKFADAQRCYNEALGLLDQDRKDYQQLAERTKILDELVPHTNAVELQDSLQRLARMAEPERNRIIDRIISDLKKKEREERDAQAEMAGAQNGGQAESGPIPTPPTRPTNAQDSKWYFYNPMVVAQGKETFQRLWGKRDNVDNWQRINKSVVPTMTNGDTLPADSVQQDANQDDHPRLTTDNPAADPHTRAYYLAQIPFSEQQLEASNKLLADGLFGSGVIFKDKMDALSLSERTLIRLVDHFPKFEKMDEAYYHLFLLYSRLGRRDRAQTYLDMLKRNHPQSEWTRLIANPYFEENARRGEQVEDSLYTATYNAFRNNRYDVVRNNVSISDTRFADGANRDKFLFIGALNQLNDNRLDECLRSLNTLVEKYPESQLSVMAGMIINGVKAGRPVRSGHFDMNDMWERRNIVLNDSDTTKLQSFSTERNTPFVFMLVYHPDSVRENQLLFELAKYNFTSYLVRDFDIKIEDADGLRRMMVTGFRNFDETLQYARQLRRQETINNLNGHAHPVIISDTNLPLLGTQFSYADYEAFYAKHFAQLKVSLYQLLTEPTEITTDKQQPAAPKTEEEIDRILDNSDDINNGIFIPIDDEKPQPKTPATGTTIPIETAKPTPQPPAGGITIPIAQPVKQPTVDKNALPTVKPKPLPQPAKTRKENTGIYFDNGLPKTQDKQKTAQEKEKDNKKSKPLDLEDEYYDLDGF
uniref:Tetratricopeptide repeat protein n=1 Tax=Prevotella sp. GTC17254 TaxID=3236794 RepID=A0AB33IYR7_9BACT